MLALQTQSKIKAAKGSCSLPSLAHTENGEFSVCHSLGKIVPKIIKMADGRVALVHFLVSIENGELKAKVISVRFSGEQTTSHASPLAICGACEKTGEIISQKTYYQPIVSPYSKLLFFVSQPTRAPAFV